MNSCFKIKNDFQKSKRQDNLKILVLMIKMTTGKKAKIYVLFFSLKNNLINDFKNKMISEAQGTWHVTANDMSFIQTKNSKGHSTDPCRTPDVTFPSGDSTPLTSTFWVRLLRQSSIQDNMLF